MSMDRPDERNAGVSEPQQGLPQAAQRKHFAVSPFWAAPVVALALLAYLAYHAIANHGPTVEVRFETADGLRVEQTEVKYKAVTLGTVQGIALSDDGDHVVVKLDMDARAEPMLHEGARFWVVRPRLQGGALAALQTGLETLVSGSYIEFDPGKADGKEQRTFTALEQPPALRSNQDGRVFVLRASEIGSIGEGSVLLYRQLPVGEVLSLELSEESSSVAIRVYVRAPYDRQVTEDTRFWNVSGLDVGMGAHGLHVEVASVRTLLSGGIAFAAPPDTSHAPPAKSEHEFQLYDDAAGAEIALYGETLPYVTYFDDSVHGLAKGSQVTLYGIQVGNVTSLALVRDPRPERRGRFSVRVGFVLSPERAPSPEVAQALYPEAMRANVAAGLRVVLETGNLLTGEKAVSLAYAPEAMRTPLHEEAGALVLPSRSHGLDSLTHAVSDVATRIAAIPFEEIGQHLNQTLRSVDRVANSPELSRALADLSATLEEARGIAAEAHAGLTPTLARLPDIADHVEAAVAHADQALDSLAGPDGDLQRKTQDLLREATEMARSVRLLANYLERHPETLLRGRTTESQR